MGEKGSVQKGSNRNIPHTGQLNKETYTESTYAVMQLKIEQVVYANAAMKLKIEKLYPP